MQVDDPLHDRQPEPASRRPSSWRPIEATTDTFALIGWNARASIPDGHAHISSVHDHFHFDCGAWGAVPDRVVDQVPEENSE